MPIGFHNLTCDASFLKHYHTPVIHFGILQNTSRRGSRPNFEWVPSRIQKFRIAAKRRTEIFVLLGGFGGMLPRKILKIKLLRLLEIAFPTNILKITFFPSSHKLLFQLEIFSNKFHSLSKSRMICVMFSIFIEFNAS